MHRQRQPVGSGRSRAAKLLGDGSTDIEISSCGTGVPKGLEREAIMAKIAAEHGYYMGGYAVPMTSELLDSADIIIVMTERHREEVTRLLSYGHWDRIVRFNDYCFERLPTFQTRIIRPRPYTARASTQSNAAAKTLPKS